MKKNYYYIFAYAVLTITFQMLPCVAKPSMRLATDQTALLALKAHISSDPSHILATNWTNSISVCSWIGVPCSLRHQRVSALNLSYMSHSGTIPPQLGHLSFLVSLDLTSNLFVGEWLYSHSYCLNVMERLNIMIDVASALEYLHHGYSTPIVHSDLKPSNVLLDEDMVAHVSDFGIAKLLCDGDSFVLTNTLATLGYIAPEYGLEGLVSTRCDVYSYGVMLMETFTRRRPSDYMFCGDVSLKSWVELSLPDEVIVANLVMNLEEAQFDKNLQCVSSILELALKCSTDSPGDRINMKEANAELKKVKRRFFH